MINQETTPALEIDSVSKSFKEKRRTLPVLSDISLTVGQGEFVSIIGPSGSGKSTLLHVIGGLTRPDAGTVRMNGAEVTGQQGHISYMPQQPPCPLADDRGQCAAGPGGARHCQPGGP